MVLERYGGFEYLSCSIRVIIFLKYIIFFSKTLYSYFGVYNYVKIDIGINYHIIQYNEYKKQLKEV